MSPRGVMAVMVLILANPTLALADAEREPCNGPGVKVQVLGSGGADFPGGRAGSAYIVWLDDKARMLIDIGPGSALHFVATGAHAADLDAILVTHLHVDHALDLPAFVSLALQENRARPLPLYGPTGNRLAPSTVAFARALFDGSRGAYRQLGDVLSPLARDGFHLDVHEVRYRPPPVGVRREDNTGMVDIRLGERALATAAEVIHGGYPVLAWRIKIAERTVVFTGDTNGEGGSLERLAQGADLLIADHAVPEGAVGVERYAHMPPSVIGRIAAQANAKRVVLSHRTRRTLNQEDASLALIRSRYNGPVTFANDLDCIAVP